MTGDPCWCMESFTDGDFDSKNVDIIACSRLRRGAEEGGTALTLGLQSHASVVLRFGERRLGIMNVCPPIPRASLFPSRCRRRTKRPRRRSGAAWRATACGCWSPTPRPA
jgi:hypothetical protein